MSAEDTLLQSGIQLPPAPKPVGSYVPVVQTGDLLFLSGALPLCAEGLTHVGKVGRDFSISEAAQAARQCAMNLVALLRGHLGSLDKVDRAVSLTGFVNGVDDFSDAAAVMNGASDFILEIFGSAGLHTRAAVSVNGLPKGAAVEVTGVFQTSS
ncbi:MAG: RidA family protein [Verrucomicrobiota bacterium]